MSAVLLVLRHDVTFVQQANCLFLTARLNDLFAFRNLECKSAMVKLVANTIIRPEVHSQGQIRFPAAAASGNVVAKAVVGVVSKEKDNTLQLVCLGNQ